MNVLGVNLHQSIKDITDKIGDMYKMVPEVFVLVCVSNVYIQTCTGVDVGGMLW